MNQESRIKKTGFTLIEMLVVIALLSIVGVMILTIFSRTLKGSNKSQIISLLKENGQSVLENMDKTIRNADSVFCADNNTGTSFPPAIVVNTGSTYTRYKFIPPPVDNTKNGYVQQEVFTSVPTPAPTPDTFCKDYTDSTVTPVILTDNNSQTGVSVIAVNSDLTENPVFTRNSSPGFADQVTISFQIKPGIGTPASLTGQIDPATFQTTVELRNN